MLYNIKSLCSTSFIYNHHLLTIFTDIECDDPFPDLLEYIDGEGEGDPEDLITNLDAPTLEDIGPEDYIDFGIRGCEPEEPIPSTSSSGPKESTSTQSPPATASSSDPPTVDSNNNAKVSFVILNVN